VGAEVVTYRLSELVLTNLIYGRIDYAYIPFESSIFQAMQLGISEEIRSIKILEKSLHICFSQKWPNIEGIVKKFNRGLELIRADGTYDRIHAKYR